MARGFNTRKLTKRQDLFVKNYLANGGDADGAARASGYATAVSGFNVILNSPTVQKAIDQGRKDLK